MTRILLIEDDPRIADLIRRGLPEEEYILSIAYDGEMGKKLFVRESFDLVITDIILPGKNGIEVCREMKQSRPDIPVIMLTALGTTDDKVEGFDAGADDYLVKPFDFRELQVRIKALLKRSYPGVAPTGNTIRYADLEIDTNLKSVTREGRAITLTPKEFNLLEYLVKNPERVLSRDEISEKVWNTHFDTGTNFIDVYINYLRKKVDKPFDKKLIHTKPGMGFILMDSASE